MGQLSHVLWACLLLSRKDAIAHAEKTGQLGTQAEKLAAHWVPNMKGAALGKFPAEILQKTKRLRAWAATFVQDSRGANFVKAAQNMINTGVLGEICAGILARRMG